jgi:hypothetical protein
VPYFMHDTPGMPDVEALALTIRKGMLRAPV